MNKKIVVITGATASGKTDLAIKLAKKINAEIICADSRIVYKDLNIVSAKPTILEQDNVVHHLIDIIEPTEEFSAGDFVTFAEKAIDEINKKGKNIIITGGTWFYIKSLLTSEELLDCPINKKLREELSKFESKELHEKLLKIDTNRAKLIHPNNKDKIIRAIEMCEAYKKPISEVKRKKNDKYDSVWYMKDLTRENLYERINLRVDLMVKNGLFEEWNSNKNKYPNSKILENTIGYKEFFDLEKGIYKNKEEAIEKIKQHTRNFAKRQLTYFRSNEKIKLIKCLEDILEDLK